MPPYPPAAFALSLHGLMSGATNQLMAPPLPMVPCKARAVGLGGAAVGSLVLGAKTQPIKK